ncbi:MAG: hypothetical protein WBG90_15820 [Saonia sp.]
MKSKNSFILFSLLLSLFLVGCDSSNYDSALLQAIPLVLNGNLESDQAKIEALLDEIINLSNSEVCSDSGKWNFTPIGYKACGSPSPIRYLAYPKNIDVDAFLKMVEVHKVSQKKLIEKWNLASTCELILEPKEIKCENGAAVLVY